MIGLENLLIKMLRATNLLLLFAIIFSGLIWAAKEPGQIKILIIGGSIFASGIVCGGVALAMHVFDEIKLNNEQLKQLIKVTKQSQPAKEPIKTVQVGK